jgi:predicted dehydrogenase
MKPKILVVGYGNIAKRHIKNIKFLHPECTVGVLRQHSRTAIVGPEAESVDHTFFDLNQALAWKPEISFITSPAPLHIDTATVLASAGCHLYIEKPLAVDTFGIAKLAGVIGAKNCKVMVGYLLRFNEALRALKATLEARLIGPIFSVKAEVGQWLPNWRPAAEYSQTVTARKSLGGGAILELSHELDYMHYLFGNVDGVFSLATTQSNLAIDVEDNAEILLKFSSGLVGNVHLDLLRHDVKRTCTVLGEAGTLHLDLLACKLEVYFAKAKEWETIYFDPDFDTNKPYLKCLENFFSACRNKKQLTAIPLSEGLRTLETILAIKKSTATSQFVKINKGND